MIAVSKIKFIFLFFIIFFAAVYLFFINKKVVPKHADFLEESESIKYNDNFGVTRQTKDEDIREEADNKSEKEKEITAPADQGVETKNINNAVGQESNFLKIEFNVPFSPQAPFGEWDDPIFQDGCEEASSLMAVYWARGQELSLEEAKKEIIAASQYEKENYEEFRDTAAADTLERIIKGYFGYKNAEVKNNISADDIIFELINGNIIILPMDGQLLENPYYTSPGPERHNILVIGYDEETEEFITNDPGTKRGAGFRYNKNLLFNAIRDYSTGYHAPIENIQKNMIVVEPK